VRSAATPRVSNHEAADHSIRLGRAVASILRDASLCDAPQDEDPANNVVRHSATMVRLT
jgi:hypothetical protein